MVRDGQKKPLRNNFGFGPFQPTELVLDLKSEFFDIFQLIWFWKAENRLQINLLEFFRSELI